MIFVFTLSTVIVRPVIIECLANIREQYHIAKLQIIQNRDVEFADV